MWIHEAGLYPRSVRRYPPVDLGWVGSVPTPPTQPRLAGEQVDNRDVCVILGFVELWDIFFISSHSPLAFCRSIHTMRFICVLYRPVGGYHVYTATQGPVPAVNGSTQALAQAHCGLLGSGAARAVWPVRVRALQRSRPAKNPGDRALLRPVPTLRPMAWRRRAT